MRRSSALFLSSSIILMAAASGAHAQATIEELVVTAERREQNLQDVPVAISAFTADTREKAGIVSIQDITNFTPGMQYNTALDRISIRGIGRLQASIAAENGVAVYNDGVFTKFTSDLALSSMLVDRVEVLRGPQGTLYGRNSIGGAINMITKRPAKEFGGEARVTVGNFSRTEVEGTITGPIADNARFRLSAVKVDQDEGYFTNVSGLADEGGVINSTYIEGQFEFDLGENLEVWVKAGYTDSTGSPRAAASNALYDPVINGTGYTTPAPYFGYTSPGSSVFTQSFVTAIAPPPALPVGTSLPSAFLGATNLVQVGNVTVNPARENLRLFNSNRTFVTTREDYNLQANVVWHGPGFDVRYLFGGRWVNDYSSGDFDPVPSPVLSYTLNFANGQAPVQIFPDFASITDQESEWSSHELNITSTTDGPLQWIVGAYYYDESVFQDFDIPAPSQPQYAAHMYLTAPGAALIPSPFPSPGRSVYWTKTNSEAYSKAAFGQIDWEITPQWKITLGARYTYDIKKGHENNLATCWMTIATVCPPSANPVNWVNVLFAPTGLQRTLPLEVGVVNNAYVGSEGGMNRDLKSSWDAWSGTAGIQWSPTDDIMAYFRYSRGYKAGGFNIGRLDPNPWTDSEHVDAYEAGAKATFFGNLQVNGTIFYYDYTNLQQQITILPPAGGAAQTAFFNLDQAESKGFELESIWRPLEPLTITANYAYLDAKMVKACCFLDSFDSKAIEPGAQPRGVISSQGQILLPVATGQELGGGQLPYSPKHKVTINAQYKLDFEPGSLTLGATYYWKDEYYASVFNRWYNLSPVTEQTDLRATWDDKDGRYRIIAFVRNLKDEELYDSEGASSRSSINLQNAVEGPVPVGSTAAASRQGLIFKSYSLLPPRTYGIQFQYRF